LKSFGTKRLHVVLMEALLYRYRTPSSAILWNPPSCLLAKQVINCFIKAIHCENGGERWLA
jgi:hypothetical protein